jgi:hypothetical protein
MGQATGQMNSLSTDSRPPSTNPRIARASAKSTTGAIAIGINTRDGDVGAKISRETCGARAR